MSPADLPQMYHDHLAATIAEEGFRVAPAFGLNADGSMVIYGLVLRASEAYHTVLSMWASGRHTELIFAFDRWALLGQGTTLGDLMAGWHLTAAGPRPFIVEYRFDPGQVLPINWHNAHWNRALTREFFSAARLFVPPVGPRATN